MVAERSPTAQSRPNVEVNPLGPSPRASGPALPITDRLGRPVSPDVVRVAILLPLTGPAGELGPQMLRAAEMAVLDIGTPNFQLLPRDTRGTPDGAAAAAQAALDEGAQLILGPLFSQNVPPAASVAARGNVNVMAFTTDAGVAGGNALVMGFIPSGQVQRVVDYASRQGVRRFALLAPDTPYGRAVADAMDQATRNAGGNLVQSVLYNPSGTEFSSEVQSLAAGAGGIDAVMLPDSGLRLRTVAPLLPYYGLRGVRVLGTGLWDGGGVGVERSLRGGWFASPQPDLRADFEQRYEQNFGDVPPRLATLAYDAVALAAVLSQIPERAGYDMASLSDPSGFAGLDGIFRFGPGGVVERGLAVLEVTEEGAIVREPAPESFLDVGF